MEVASVHRDPSHASPIVATMPAVEVREETFTRRASSHNREWLFTGSGWVYAPDVALLPPAPFPIPSLLLSCIITSQGALRSDHLNWAAPTAARQRDVAELHCQQQVSAVADPASSPNVRELCDLSLGKCIELTPIVLGRGSAGVVRLARLSTSATEKQLVAVKYVCIPQCDPLRAQNLVTEIQIMKRCSGHPNFLNYYGVFAPSTSQVACVMEFADGSTLQDLVDSCGPLREWEAVALMREVLLALHYLHTDLHMLHRDVKPYNILLTLSGGVKLADFGIAKNASSARTFCGSSLYCAPEVCGGNVYGEPADVYSAGIVFQMLLSGDVRAVGKRWTLGTSEGGDSCWTLPESVLRASPSLQQPAVLKQLQ